MLICKTINVTRILEYISVSFIVLHISTFFIGHSHYLRLAIAIYHYPNCWYLFCFIYFFISPLPHTAQLPSLISLLRINARDFTETQVISKFQLSSPLLYSSYEKIHTTFGKIHTEKHGNFCDNNNGWRSVDTEYRYKFTAFE